MKGLVGKRKLLRIFIDNQDKFKNEPELKTLKYKEENSLNELYKMV